MNPQNEAAFNNIFDIAPAPANTEPQIVEVTALAPAQTAELAPTVHNEITPAERDATEDYEFSRGALKSVAAEAQNVLHRASDVAMQIDSPRAFEAVAVMIKATLEAHQALHGLHKDSAAMRIANRPAGSGGVNVEKGIIFNGTSEELLRMIDGSGRK